MVCDGCEAEYCPKCLLALHSGDCDQKEVEFFEQNLHYRRCKRCRFVIEKNQGCNHMTCRVCNHEFCWMCLGDWKDHGHGTGGFYKCNKYDQMMKEGGDLKLEEEKRDLAQSDLN